MVGNRSAGTSLFDLLARAWTLDDEVVQTGFNRADSAVYFRLQSGKLALATTRDSESPKSRTRIETDTGRTTIRQRENPIPEARIIPIALNAELPIVRFGENGFMAVDADGVPHQITAQGQCIEKANSIVGPQITSLCSDRSGETLAIAGPLSICVYKASSLQVLAEIDIERHISCMAFSADGEQLAAWGEGSLTLIDKKNPASAIHHIDGINEVSQINWDSSGNYLSCTANTHAFWIVDANAGTARIIEGYPGKVKIATFNEAGKALVTSGAFRLAGWSTEDLPGKDHPGTPLSSGKPGMVIVNTLAAHPKRSLVAVGYPDGLVTISSVGTPEEMMVHKENGTEVNDLAWSDTGEHLSIAFKSGKAAVVTFPDKLFK
ncbi:WD40 repeat domain-containing protein [Granulosicoccus antarcticus]|uniref:Anaphase-promoting complex subunit 4 WD40 domain-containing protein n=1 Tax=Granulosicoccus antarcticus IMCC3135 TaxID=1192854 RepID=A0A2Z2NU80_9GAMM|nr:hypothetical protein [Granulosicoccus antarcticus]ASJ74859.1 hypothetical protein IMCC3135_23950 [Granulosicoccus antarcticus IMCC3135]